MAFRTWGRLLLTALGVSVLAGAGQLGLAYGLGIVQLTGSFTGSTVDQWPAQLTWVGWFAANAAVAGAVLTERLARRDTEPATTGRVLAVGTAAALGAFVVAPLCMQPARAAELVSVDPVFAVGICAVLGAVVGAGAAIAVLLTPPLGWNITAVAGAVWLLALTSTLPSLGATGPLRTARLGVLEPTWLSADEAQRLSLFLLPLLALLAGAATAALARWRGQVPLVSGATGVAGPVLVAFAYLTAGPGDGIDRYQTTPYYGALIAVAAGVLGAAAAALLRRPVSTRATGAHALSPTAAPRPLPAGPTPPADVTGSARSAGVDLTVGAADAVPGADPVVAPLTVASTLGRPAEPSEPPAASEEPAAEPAAAAAAVPTEAPAAGGPDRPAGAGPNVDPAKVTRQRTGAEPGPEAVIDVGPPMPAEAEPATTEPAGQPATTAPAQPKSADEPAVPAESTRAPKPRRTRKARSASVTTANAATDQGGAPEPRATAATDAGPVLDLPEPVVTDVDGNGVDPAAADPVGSPSGDETAPATTGGDGATRTTPPDAAHPPAVHGPTTTLGEPSTAGTTDPAPSGGDSPAQDDSRTSPVEAAWPIPRRTGPDGTESTHPPVPAQSSDPMPRARHRAPLPDLNRAASWEALAGARRAGPVSTDPPGATANPASADAEPATEDAIAASDATIDHPAGAPDVPGQSAGRARSPLGLFRRNRPRADTESTAEEPLPAQEEEYVDWVTGLSRPLRDNEPEQESGRRSLRSSGRHHRN
ncbi:hypothetical protein [Micromonospora avicenniae]|uniref:Uncharacterized protein n=1 Tax=Micromonospora avicenniae TaxID=1198245 RepID=A0A1N6Q5L6_9ACTN|nr:hypothetical protein [Micromonospora avicenniae]SIQ11769.1 hypothetical protein SAMN05444858_101181 [Micromonospora avicenniae]